MRIDLREIANPVERTLPWDLELVGLDGQAHQTTRPTIGLIVELESQGSKSAALETLKRIFVEPPADLLQWPAEMLGAAVAAYMVAFGQRIEKNSPALVAAIKEKMAPRGTSGV